MDNDLIELAKVLASHGVGRPRSTFLRRSVSSAYYALFHRLARLCAEQMVGANAWWDVYTPAYRSLDHKSAKDAFARFRSSAPQEIVKIGEIFASLQQERHRADYNPEPFPHNRLSTLALVGQAGLALRLIEALPPPQKTRLAVLLLTRPR